MAARKNSIPTEPSTVATPSPFTYLESEPGRIRVLSSVIAYLAIGAVGVVGPPTNHQALVASPGSDKHADREGASSGADRGRVRRTQYEGTQSASLCRRGALMFVGPNVDLRK